MKGFRTVLINMFMALPPVLEISNAADFGLTGKYAMLYPLIVTVVNIVLRAITTTPIGQKK